MSVKKLCLGSASPRRYDLLAGIGFQLEVRAAEIDESPDDNEPPLEYVSRLAKEKAFAVAKKCIEDQLDLPILTADTIVVCDNSVFVKPVDYADAQQMWRRMSGNEHQVVTAITLLESPQSKVCLTDIAVTNVIFRQIAEDQMKQYWHSGEPADKAGGYAIQGLASAWVKSIQGSYSGVVGLPLYETNKLLSQINMHWL